MNKKNNKHRLTTTIIFLLHLSLQIINAAATASPEHILVNCGSLGKSNSSDGRSWDGDVGTELSPNIHTPCSFLDADVSGSVPYESGRIITSKCSYIFPVSAGQKALRLYFSAATNPGISFAVTANQYTLVRDFRANQTASADSVKEFIINVEQNQNLNLTFWPSANSVAFINGIEIVSIPAGLYTGSLLANCLDQNETALETIYRLNVGGSPVAAVNDSGMFRTWLQDAEYLSGKNRGSHVSSNATISLHYSSKTPNYSAPATVYRTARVANPSVGLTWMFPVDSGFRYLIRLYFCQFMPDINRLLFDVFINNSTAARRADITFWAGGAGIPIFRDHIVSVPDQILNLNLTLRHHASLNGLEIFKLNNADHVVDNPGRLATSSPEKKKKAGLRVGVLVGGLSGGGGLILLLISLLIIRQLQRRRRQIVNGFSSESTESSSSSGPSASLPTSDHCRRFLLEEIRSATSNFDPTLVVGTGGFGTVYRGFIDDTTIAFKRLNPASHQGACEFKTEIKVLCNLRHAHLVSLLGYSDDNGEMILAYDYMVNGTLRDHLYGTEKPPLTWQQRLEICIGAARGLHYLHRVGKPNTIHRDVKSNNILLDDKLVAKISDFGLSKTGDPDLSFTHITTNVKGTFGYLDPRYFMTKKLTRKSDVYAFGVVLFEVLSGRAAVDMQLADEQHSLATWASYCITNGQVEKLIDSNLLREEIWPASLEVFVGVAGRCLDTHLHERPAMADVVVSLEFALELQRNTSSAQHDEVEEEKININDGDTSSREKRCRDLSCTDLITERNGTKLSCEIRHYTSL